jgi:MtN3 and saliva related transmembrane protein
MQPVDFVGSFAAFFSTVSFVPQVWKTLKTRDTQSISLLMYSLFLIGVLAWLTWALMLSQWPAVAANTITALLAAIVFTLKVHAVVVKKEKP